MLVKCFTPFSHQVEKEHSLENPCDSSSLPNLNEKQPADDESVVEADRFIPKQKPTSIETVKNHINEKKSKPNKIKKESKNINQSASPKHRPRINPFDDLSDEDSPAAMDNRNPFDEETNPFGSEALEQSTNPFAEMDAQENYDIDNQKPVNGINPFASEVSRQEPKSLLVDTTELLKGINYEVSFLTFLFRCIHKLSSSTVIFSVQYIWYYSHM